MCSTRLPRVTHTTLSDLLLTVTSFCSLLPVRQSSILSISLNYLLCPWLYHPFSLKQNIQNNKQNKQTKKPRWPKVKPVQCHLLKGSSDVCQLRKHMLYWPKPLIRGKFGRIIWATHRQVHKVFPGITVAHVRLREVKNLSTATHPVLFKYSKMCIWSTLSMKLEWVSLQDSERT